MRFIADENFPGRAVNALRRLGHDVIWLPADQPGMPDPAIFDWALRDGRIVLTFDKDFGKIARDAEVSGPCGVILFRIAPPLTTEEIPLLVEMIQQRSDWAGCFAVIDRDRVRIRPMSELGDG